MLALPLWSLSGSPSLIKCLSLSSQWSSAGAILAFSPCSFGRAHPTATQDLGFLPIPAVPVTLSHDSQLSLLGPCSCLVSLGFIYLYLSLGPSPVSG